MYAVSIHVATDTKKSSLGGNHQNASRMRNLFLSLFLLVGIFFPTIDSNAQQLGVGDDVSTLELEEYLQAPKQHYDYEDFKDKALVLAFWATWHAPSIKMIPHLNELAKQFEIEPIHFVSITYEDKAAVTHFLKTHAINGWIGLDNDRSVHKMFGIYSIPRTVLISQSGKIVAITETNQISAEILEQLLTNDSIAIQSNNKPTTTDSSVISKFDGVYSSSSSTVNDLLQTAYRYSPARIIAPDTMLNTRLNISIQSAGSRKDGFYNDIQNALKHSLRITVKEEIRNTEVYVLTAPKGVTQGLRVHNYPIIRTSSTKGVIAASGAPINGLVKQLEEILGIPVVDGTGFKDNYDWVLTFDHDNPTSVANSVKEQLGLNMVLEQKDIEMLVVKAK